MTTQSPDSYQTICLYGWGLRLRLRKALINACFLVTHGHPTPELRAYCWSVSTVCRQTMSETQPQFVSEHASVCLFNCRIESFELQTKIHNMFKLEGLGQTVNGKAQAAFYAVLCGHWILPKEAVSWWASKPRTAYALIWNGNQEGEAPPREAIAADPDCRKWDKFLLLVTWRGECFYSSTSTLDVTWHHYHQNETTNTVHFYCNKNLRLENDQRENVYLFSLKVREYGAGFWLHHIMVSQEFGMWEVTQKARTWEIQNQDSACSFYNNLFLKEVTGIITRTSLSPSKLGSTHPPPGFTLFVLGGLFVCVA